MWKYLVFTSQPKGISAGAVNVTAGKVYPIERIEEYGIMADDIRYWIRNDEGELTTAEWWHGFQLYTDVPIA